MTKGTKEMIFSRSMFSIFMTFLYMYNV